MGLWFVPASHMLGWAGGGGGARVLEGPVYVFAIRVVILEASVNL